MKRKIKVILSMLLVLCMMLQPTAGYAVNPSSDVVINVLDFGADPNGVNDSAEAIWNALEEAKKQSENGTKHVIVDFPTGEYHIYKDKAQKREYHTSNTNSIENPVKTIGILLEGQKNVTINGNGSLFMMHGNMMALAVAKSENIQLNNFSWDFAVPTVSEMTVLDLGAEGGKQYTDFYIPKCFPYEISGNTIKWSSELSPYTGKPYWTATGIHNSYGIVAYQPDDEMTRIYGTGEDPFKNVASIVPLGDNKIRITYNGNRPGMQKKGSVIQLTGNAHRETAGAFTWESKNVTADHVNVHFMHGFGWLVQMSENVYYRNCNLMPRKNSGHLSVSFADGIHASGAKGDFVIENCNFSHTHDDPINMHGTFTRVERRMDDHTLQLNYIHNQQGGFPQYHVGDQVQFFTRDTLESTDGEKQYTVSEIVSNPGENGNNLRTMVIKFAEKLPGNLSDQIGGQPKYVAENVTYAPSVTIKGCTFKNIATRAILCTTRNKTVIENNVFYPSSMAAIFLSNDSNDWYESGPIRDMTIKNNTFYVKDIGGRTSWPCAPAIWVHPVTKGNGLPDAENPIHKNITVDGNTFYMDEDMVVKAESVENFKFTNNKVLRMNPEISLQIQAEKSSVSVGEVLPLTVNATGKSNTKDIDNVFEFKKSKGITISGNTYDDGLKKYIVAEDEATKNNITNNDKDLQIVGDRNQPASEAVSNIRYTSSDPETVWVDGQGNITGKKAGTADVFAYYEWNGTLIRSNTVSVTVEGQAATGNLTILPSGPQEVKAGETVAFSVEGNPADVVWSVSGFEGDQATDVAAIDGNGVLTGNKNGVVWVKASTPAATGRVAVEVYGGAVEGLNNKLSITREDKNTYTLSDTGVTVKMQNGDLYTNTNNVKNLFLYDPADVDKTNLRTVVKVDGLPVKENGQWDTASFILYKDDDNYVTVGKKSHFDGITHVIEKKGAAQENGGQASENAVSSAYIGMTVKGSTITLDYLNESGVWTKVADVTDHTVGDAYKIGMACWHSKDRGKSVTFSDFHVGSADMTYEQLCAQEPVPFVKKANDRPVVSNVAVTQENGVPTVSYDFADEDGEGRSLYCWTWTEDGQEKTVVTSSKTFPQAGVSEVFCQVYPVDVYGEPGTPSDKVGFSVSQEDTEELYKIAVNGETIYKRGDNREMSVVLPQEAGTIGLDYASVNNTMGETQIFVNDQAVEGTFDNTDQCAVSVKDQDVVKIKRGAEEYLIHVTTVPLHEAKIQSVAIGELAFDQTAPFDGKGTVITANHISGGTLTVQVSDHTGDLKILQGEYRAEVPVTKTGNTYSAPVAFANGMNTFYVTALGADGTSKEQYIVNVVYNPESSVRVTGITLNDKALEGFKNEQKEYVYHLAPEEEELRVAVAAVPDSRVQISLNGVVTDGASATFHEFKDGENSLVVRAMAEDGITTDTYRLSVVKPYDTNVLLQSAVLGEKDITKQITEDGSGYVAYISDPSAPFKVEAQDQRAAVKILQSGSLVAEGQGQVEKILTVYDDAGQIEIEITAADGTTKKSYPFQLKKAAYLSDLEWESATVGYGDGVNRDANHSKQPIKLADQEGNPVEFAKGLGTHAESQIVYQIEGKGYVAIEGFCGLDYGKYNAQFGSVQFQIFADDTKIFDSDVMSQKTPMASINAKIPEGTRKVTLKVLPGENNWDDHANWADVKFVSVAGNRPAKVDKTALENLVSEINKLNKEDYTENSYKDVQKLKEQAQKVLDKEQATEEEVQDALNQLMDGKDQLVNVTELKDQLTKAEQAKKDAYSDQAWKTLQNQIKAAKGLLKNGNKTEVDQAVDALKKALDDKIKPTIGPTVVPTTVPTVTPTAVPTAVPTTEPTAVPTVVPTAVPTVTPTTGPTVVPTTKPTAVPTAVPTAGPTVVPTTEPTIAPEKDKEELEKLYHANEELKKDSYTAESWMAFEEAMKAAKSVLEKEDASKAEIDAAMQQLQACVNGLKKVPETTVSPTKEPAKPTITSEPVKPVKPVTPAPQKPVKPGNDKAPSTGDMGAAIPMTGLALSGLTVLAAMLRKRSKNK